jgi:RES domain-containing protein
LHEPGWAFQPVSGEGSRLKGGRFNPIGTPALYLSCSVQTCALEMGHGFKGRFDPSLVCSYDVDIDDVVDLRTIKARRSASVTLAELKCAWRLDMSNGVEPKSWKVVRRLRAAGASGILVPSFANGATRSNINLVLWEWTDKGPHKVTPYDPKRRLPKDQSSWT